MELLLRSAFVTVCISCVLVTCVYDTHVYGCVLFQLGEPENTIISCIKECDVHVYHAIKLMQQEAKIQYTQKEWMFFLTVLYSTQSISEPSQATERGEGMMNTGMGKGGVKGRSGFFPYELSVNGVPLQFIIAAAWPIHVCVCNGERSSEVFCHICTRRQTDYLADIVLLSFRQVQTCSRWRRAAVSSRHKYDIRVISGKNLILMSFFSILQNRFCLKISIF
jgi:hypothetical protein